MTNTTLTKTIYVDFDGTIVDVFNRYRKIIENYIYKTFDDKDEYSSLKRKGQKDHQIIKSVFNIDVDINDYSIYKTKHLEDKELLKLDNILGNPHEAYEKLKLLNYNVVLLSQRRNKVNFLYEISYLGLENCFDKVVCVHPSPANAKLNYLKNVFTEKDVIVGDGRLELESAIQLNLKGYFVSTGLMDFCDIEDIVTKYKTYNEVVNHLGG